MRISDWSSDVCSSDLFVVQRGVCVQPVQGLRDGGGIGAEHGIDLADALFRRQRVVAFEQFRQQRLLDLGVVAPGGLLQRGLDPGLVALLVAPLARSEEHTSELQSLMRTSYAVFCLKKKN